MRCLLTADLPSNSLEITTISTCGRSRALIGSCAGRRQAHNGRQRPRAPHPQPAALPLTCRPSPCMSCTSTSSVSSAVAILLRMRVISSLVMGPSELAAATGLACSCRWAPPHVTRLALGQARGAAGARGCWARAAWWKPVARARTAGRLRRAWVGMRRRASRRMAIAERLLGARGAGSGVNARVGGW